MKNLLDVQLRNQVKNVIKTDFDQALKFARSISDGWYRCQSLAEISHIMGCAKTDFLKIAKEALQAANETEQPNRIVSASSWIIWVMAKRMDIKDSEISAIVEKMLETIRLELHPIRRADALLFLFEAIYTRKNLREMVLKPLLDACQEMKSWKKPRILGDIVLVLAVDDLKRAETVLEMIEKEAKRKRLLKDIEENKWIGAHDFLPYYAKVQTNQ